MMSSSKNIYEVKPGEKIVFLTGPGDFVDYPAYAGIAYGMKKSRFGDELRVKVTDERGNVSWHFVRNLMLPAAPGCCKIGAYYMGRNS